jgi:hypothetical protein
MIYPIITKLGGRRFILTMGCGIATTFLIWFDKIDGFTYSAVILGTVAAYITGNTWQKKNEADHNDQ